MNVETVNAVMREQARIREEIGNIPSVVNAHIFGGATLIPRSHVLKLLNPADTVIVEATYRVMSLAELNQDTHDLYELSLVDVEKVAETKQDNLITELTKRVLNTLAKDDVLPPYQYSNGTHRVLTTTKRLSEIIAQELKKPFKLDLN